MADHYIIIDPESLKLPVTNPARIDGGQNDYLALFDDTVSQSGRKKFRNPDNYIGTPRLVLQFKMADTQTGTLTVKWGISVMAVSPDDAVDAGEDDFDTVNTGTKTLANNESEGVLKELDIALTNFDSGIAGDRLTLEIALDITGTASGDTELETISYKYSDS
ncbi:hypothetical protein KAR10_02825 [bacterium]|nr:hypothetical protein [bacterium]